MTIEEDWQRGWNGIAADLAQVLDVRTASQPLSATDVETAAGAHAALVALLARSTVTSPARTTTRHQRAFASPTSTRWPRWARCSTGTRTWRAPP